MEKHARKTRTQRVVQLQRELDISHSVSLSYSNINKLFVYTFVHKPHHMGSFFPHIYTYTYSQSRELIWGLLDWLTNISLIYFFFLIFSCWLHCHSMEDFFFQVAVEGGLRPFLKTLWGSHPFYSRVPLLEESHLFPRVENKYIRK